MERVAPPRRTSHSAVSRALLLAMLWTPTLALDNGFTRPERGWSSWYAAPLGSQVTDTFVRESARALVDSGLGAKGFHFVNVDEGWLKGRFNNGTIYEDFEKFPYGMAGLGEFINSLPVSPGAAETMRFGLYTCRGTCQCSTSAYSGPGSHGFEAQDTEWMLAAGAQWLKVDSCCGSQTHATAFSDYAKFRDALNASGKRVWFNLCGWEAWYAPSDPSIDYAGGFSLGNSFRIFDDGGSWGAITGAINTMAAVSNWTRAGGYPDPDNILGPHGTVGVVTEAQARTQMILWSLAPTQLIIGEDVTRMSVEFIATLSNDELLDVNWDTPFMGASRRIVGGDLTWPCSPSGGAVAQVLALTCEAGDAAQLFFLNSTDASLRPAENPSNLLSTVECGFDDGDLVSVFKAGTACAGGATWTHEDDGTIRGGAGKCLDEYMLDTERIDLWTCINQTNLQWVFNASGAAVGGFATGTFVNGDSGKCLSTAPPLPTSSCTNVWARPLSSGDVAVAFVNNGSENTTVVCDAACFSAAGLADAKGLRVRDMLEHADLPELTPPFSISVHVAGEGAAEALRFSRL